MKTEVAVIGGGATGAGVLRDLALRGIDAILLEKGELTAGTSGRNHGLLHSGARYAVEDPESARECFAENQILKRIASPCIEPTGGFFLALPRDPPHYAEDLLKACSKLDLPAEEIPVANVLRKEPALSPYIKRAIEVPDASIDPFRLIRSNAEDAEKQGARIFPHHQVVAISTSAGIVQGLQAIDSQTGEELAIACPFIINAAGVWAGNIARMAGASLDILFSKGSLVVLNRRLVNSVMNRCRPPSNGDILVPHGPALILGTTSQTVSEIEDPSPEEEEVDLLLSEGELMVPQVSSARAIRAYAGVRPLMGTRETGEDSRKVSRDFLLVDHGEADQIKGFFSIMGGKLTTYRLMAEKTVDAVVKAMGRRTPCTAAEKLLPFSEQYNFHDLGSRLRQIGSLKSYRETRELLCECELVSREEIAQEIRNQPRPHLKEIQERTRVGMGPCQGGFCSPRLTALLLEAGKIPPGTSLPMLKHFLEERWKGTRPVLWGPQLREEQLIQALYTEFFNLDHS
jgi:glycerol-3-phosphate dehydrogenase